jgi:hypothetical protein
MLQQITNNLLQYCPIRFFLFFFPFLLEAAGERIFFPEPLPHPGSSPVHGLWPWHPSLPPPQPWRLSAPGHGPFLPFCPCHGAPFPSLCSKIAAITKNRRHGCSRPKSAPCKLEEAVPLLTRNIAALRAQPPPPLKSKLEAASGNSSLRCGRGKEIPTVGMRVRFGGSCIFPSIWGELR